MSEKNSYDYQDCLNTNAGATAAAISIIEKACSSSSESGKVGVIRCIIAEDFIKDLRDKIKEAASE